MVKPVFFSTLQKTTQKWLYSRFECVCIFYVINIAFKVKLLNFHFNKRVTKGGPLWVSWANFEKFFYPFFCTFYYQWYFDYDYGP
jgi:hypothetical protein